MSYFWRHIYIYLTVALKQITLEYMIFMPKYPFSDTGCSLLWHSRHKIRLTADLREIMIRLIVGSEVSSWGHSWYYDGLLQRLKHNLLRPLTYKVHGVRQNHVATCTCIRWYVCLCIFEFVTEALTFICSFRLGNTPKSMAWAPTHLAYTPSHREHNPTHPIYIYPHTLHVHIHISTYKYTPGIHTHIT